MSVLRRRIGKAQMAETNYKPPAEWAAWEKQCYPAYVADAASSAAGLQLALRGTRPSVANTIAAVKSASKFLPSRSSVDKLLSLLQFRVKSASKFL